MTLVRAMLALTAALALLRAIPASADCKLHSGVRVVLYSTTEDPDVLAWDSRIRLRDYHASSFDEAEQLLPHAVLEPPGTRAVVSSCVPNFVTSLLLGGPEDAVGIIITSGPDRGHGRWVLGSDVRPTVSSNTRH
ncbi:MAG TPA: hypothetical protein VKR05_00075 [Candidatus Cybelea sp.]|nr:hypothetical protein [Candidatus Cybelea sp.]